MNLNLNRYQGRWARRLGWIAGSALQLLARIDRYIGTRLTAKGIRPGAVQVIRWSIKLVLLIVLLYVTVWLALLVAFFVIAAWVARNAERRKDEDQPEWDYGYAGYGLYTPDGYRIDPHDVEDEQD